MNYETNIEEFKIKMNDLLMKAPPQFLNAFQYLSSDNLNETAAIFAFTIPQLKSINKEWAGTACCCYAFCMKEAEQFEEAIKNSKQGKELGLNLVGFWYYHDVMDHSLNYINGLPAALEAANEAIEFFSKENSIGDLVNHLLRKANILKQMAAPISRDENRKNEAKELIIEAIHSLLKSLSMIPDEWEEMKGELDAVYRIAARVGVKTDDLKFLDSMTNINHIIRIYFSEDSLTVAAVSEYFNMAIDLRKQGNRNEAIKYFRKALDICSEEKPEDRAFKAFISYQYGVCLLKMHNLEGIRPTTKIDHKNLEAVRQIQNLWNDTLRLYNSLDSKFLSDFDKRYNLTESSWNIKRDPIMSLKVE